MTHLLAYTPFVHPAPLWDYWYLLIVPLATAVSVVYKTIKCRHVHQIPKEAAILTLWIIAAMIGVALGVWLVYMIFVQWT
jgi:hypothetical protein